MHILLISAGFAPWGGPAAMRATKLAGCALQDAQSVSVLTTSSDCSHTFDDPDLMNDVLDANIIRVSDGTNYVGRDWIAGTLDYRILKVADRLRRKSRRRWVADCVDAGLEQLKDNRPDVIYATPPVPEVVNIASELADAWNVPYVMDFRDPPWEIGMSDVEFSGHLERCCLACFNTPPAASRVQEEHPQYADKVECWTNGVDLPEECPDFVSATTDHSSILFAGGVYPWVADAVGELMRLIVDPGLTVDVYGFLEPKRAKEIARIRELGGCFHEPVPSAEVIRLMRSAWANLVTLPPEFQISSKIYLAVASGRPVLLFGSSRSATELLNQVPGIFYFDADTSESQFTELRSRIDAYDAAGEWKARFEWLSQRSWPEIYRGIFSRFTEV